MVDPLLPENVSITINGSTVTTKLREFTESGGEYSEITTKTMNRTYRRSRKIPSDWSVNFSGAVVNDDFNNIFETDLNSIPIVLNFGSYTITYNNAYNIKHNLNITADDYLKLDIGFVVPFYNTTGSVNRVIS